MTRNKNKYRYDSSSEFHPRSNGQAAYYHKPRRNHWGNLFDEDTLEGNRETYQDYSGSNSLYDSEDDNDSFYGSDSWE